MLEVKQRLVECAKVAFCAAQLRGSARGCDCASNIVKAINYGIVPPTLGRGYGMSWCYESLRYPLVLPDSPSSSPQMFR